MILVIGGDSFLGHYFCTNSSLKAEITVVSRINTALKNEKIVNDLFNIPDEYFLSVDVVVSFIGIAHRKENKENRSLFYFVNRDLVLHLAQQAKKNGVAHFIQMSSISVYGETANINIKTPEKPVSAYGRSKLEADTLLQEEVNDHFSIAIVRPPMVYGYDAPGNWGKLEGLVKKISILPFKKINNQRTFIYVRNLQISLDWIIANRLYGIQIICDDFDLSTQEIIELIMKRINKNGILIDYKLISVLKFLFPKQFEKLFGNLIVKGNHKVPHLLNKERVFEDYLLEG